MSLIPKSKLISWSLIQRVLNIEKGEFKEVVLVPIETWLFDIFKQ